VDIRTEVAHAFDPHATGGDELAEKINECCAAIKQKFSESIFVLNGQLPRILIDEDQRSPYKPVSESKGPLDRINVRTGNQLLDLRERSSVIAALKSFRLLRAYHSDDDSESKDAIRRIVEGEISRCRKQAP
jgi:hypothetical protein